MFEVYDKLIKHDIPIYEISKTYLSSELTHLWEIRIIIKMTQSHLVKLSSKKNIFLGIVQVFQEKKRNSIRANPDDE